MKFPLAPPVVVAKAPSVAISLPVFGNLASPPLLPVNVAAVIAPFETIPPAATRFAVPLGALSKPTTRLDDPVSVVVIVTSPAELTLLSTIGRLLATLSSPLPLLEKLLTAPIKLASVKLAPPTDEPLSTLVVKVPPVWLIVPPAVRVVMLPLRLPAVCLIAPPRGKGRTRGGDVAADGHIVTGIGDE